MNLKFAESTTSVAFALTLSRRQCNSLLRLAAFEGSEATYEKHIERLYVLSVDGLQGLERRGLVFWHRDEKGQANGFGGMTEAGKLVAKLLVEAGLTVNATNTNLVLKRLEHMNPHTEEKS